MSTRSNTIKEAILAADEMKRYSLERAKDVLYEAFSRKIQDSFNSAINETVGVGKDQPSGYNQDEDQDALAYGSSKHSTAKKDDINKGGKGPQKLEGSLGFDENFGEDEFSSNAVDEFGDSSEDDLDVIPVKEDELFEMFDEEDLDETSDEEELDETSDEEDLDEASEEEDLDETSEEEVDETAKVADESVKQLQAENKRLKTKLQEAFKAIKQIKSRFDETNLLNAKLSGAIKYVRSPNLNQKQKESIIEAFDRAKNAREVKLIVATLSESLRHNFVRKPVIERNVRPASSKRMNESLNNEFSRLQELAGINT